MRRLRDQTHSKGCANTADCMSLSGILCLRHSMSKRSIYAKESKGRCGGHGGIAAHFV